MTEKFAPKLNKVDEFVKKMILTYPSLFKSRFDALSHAFLTNVAGLEWDKHGCLASCRGDRFHKTMNYADLDERATQLKEKVESNTLDCLDQLYAGYEARLKREYAERRLIEADIDLYAVEHVMGEDTQYGVAWLSNFNPDFCTLSQDVAPFATMDTDWANAALEMMKITRDALWRGMHMYSRNFSRDTADPVLLRKYDQVNLILDQLDQVTHHKEKDASNDAVAKKIVDEILEEERSAARKAKP